MTVRSDRVQNPPCQCGGWFGAFVSGDSNSVQENVLRSHPRRSADVGIVDAGTETTLINNVVNGFTKSIDGDTEGNVITPAGSLVN